MRPECRSAAGTFGLALPRGVLAGRAGERLGRGTGSSLEFMDFRDYTPGDDLRHVDWRTYARTDQLKVRLFREEVSPNLDIIADLSASMAVTERKEQALRDLVEAAAFWASRWGCRPRRLSCGGEVFEDGDAVPLSGAADGDLLPREALRPRGLRLLISDFLFRDDPAPMLRKLASGAAHLYVIQLLDPWEWEPVREGTITLRDCETGDRLDLELDPRTIDAYRRRLDVLTGSVRRAMHGVGGSYGAVRADHPLAMFRRDLLPAGMVEAVA